MEKAGVISSRSNRYLIEFNDVLKLVETLEQPQKTAFKKSECSLCCRWSTYFHVNNYYVRENND